jgi:ABC-type Fe3+ transport system permease subunit
MFLAMLLSNLAGLTAAFGRSEQRRQGRWALWLLLAGGMILGPLVQKYAFGELWTGVPFGWDLTDNKTLIAIIGWVLAVVMNRKRERPGYTIAAAILLLLVYSIPHSLFGSQLDYATGTVTQG